MVFLSPGVKTQEVDESAYISNISSCVAGLIGAASKGEFNKPTLITSPTALVETFGPVLDSDFGLLAALEFLKKGNQLYYIRVGENSAAQAQATIGAGFIVVKAKDCGDFYNGFGAQVISIEDNVATIGIYKDGVQEEVYYGSFTEDNPDYPFIDDIESDNYTFELQQIAVQTPTITAATGFVQNADNIWEQRFVGGSEALGSISFTVNTPVANPTFVAVSDTATEGAIQPGAYGTVSVEGQTITVAFPGDGITFPAPVTPEATEQDPDPQPIIVTWDKVFEVTLTSATGATSKEKFKISLVAEGNTTVTPGSGSSTEGPTVLPTYTVDTEIKLFEGGNNGAPLTPQTIVGSVGKGLQLFRDVNTYTIDLIAAPGFYQAIVINELLDIAETRTDCLAVVDPPEGLTFAQAIEYHNGLLTGEGYPKKALNSSFGAIYYPWTKVYDQSTQKELWCPPSGPVLGAIANNDNVANPWNAPAGLNRGLLNSVLELERSLDEGARDALYSNGNVINPITNYHNQGFAIWGQRTLQRKDTALNRVNVRRMFCMVRRAVADSTAYFVFEQNDPLTWRRWVGMIEPYLKSIKTSQGMEDFKVKMDEETVTATHRDRLEMPGIIWIKPTKAAEFIPIKFVVTTSGAQFDE